MVLLSTRTMCHDLLEQGLADVFSKGPDNKYVRHWA